MRLFASLRGRIVLTLALAAIGALNAPLGGPPPSARTVSPASHASCGGRDLLAELAAHDGKAVKRIEVAARQTPNGEAQLWRVTGKGVRPSHLFGTIHVSDARVTRLSPATRAALDGSERVALEVADMSPAALGKAIGEMREKVVYGDGRSLAGLLTREEHGAAKAAAMRAGLPEAFLNVAKPWLVTLLLAASDCERSRSGAGLKPLDVALGDIARSRGLPVVGLESLGDQLSAMAAVPESDQLTVLRASLKLEHQANDALETILQRYLAREITKVWPLQLEMWRRAGFDPGAFASFRHQLVTLRNARMRDAALPLLRQGNAFIAVGALHMIGEDGLVALLRQAGYQVTPIE